MIKVDTAILQHATAPEGRKANNSNAREQTDTAGQDIVAISEEGKKRHIMGQLMANLSGDETARGRFRK